MQEIDKKIYNICKSALRQSTGDTPPDKVQKCVLTLKKALHEEDYLPGTVQMELEKIGVKRSIAERVENIVLDWKSKGKK